MAERSADNCVLSEEYSELLRREWVKVPELASALRVPRVSIYRAIQRGDFEGVIVIGVRTYRIPATSVAAYIKSCGFQPGQSGTEGMDAG